MIKRIYLTINTLIFTLIAQAQPNAPIYGLAVKFPDADVFLAELDPVYGQVNNISQQSVDPFYTTAITSALDPYQKIYYKPEQGYLLSIDLISGEVVNNPEITFSNGRYLDGMIFNDNDSLIYTLALSSDFGEAYLATIDPESGYVSNISSSSVITFNHVSFTSTTIDTRKGLYYLYDGGQLTAVDIHSGDIVTSSTIHNPSGGHFEAFHYNPSDSTIYGLTVKQDSGPNGTDEIYLSKIDPETGKVTNISSSSLTDAYTTSFSTLDPYQNIFYFGPGTWIISVDIKTGELLSNLPISNPGATQFDGFHYGGAYRLPTGINPVIYSNGTLNLFPNPSNGKLSIIELPCTDYEVSISDVTGKARMTSFYRQTSSLSLDLTSFPKGIYIIHLRSKDRNYAAKVSVID